MRYLALEELLPVEHRARVVWRYVESLDLSPLYQRIEARPGVAGRNATAPEVLMALWLLATLDSVSSAREIARRSESDLPYMWVRGDTPVNYHTLSDFRSDNREFFEKVLTDTVAALVHEGFAPLETIAQDGMRVRASAGSGSLRRKPSLKNLHQRAAEHVKKMQEESEDEGQRMDANARREAARQRAAREKEERIRESLKQVDELHKQKEKRKKGDGPKARCSTTDPEARKMKMANGGFRPAYNFQFATDADARVIAGVHVTNSGGDGGQMAPMHESIQKNYGRTPDTYLVDTPYATKEEVTTVAQRGTKVISSIAGAAKMRKHGNDPHTRQSRDTDEYAAFRERMGKPENQELYKQRPSIAEFPNAVCRNMGCRLLRVRGLVKVQATALLYAITFNLQRMIHLKAIS
jgi:transposase